MICFPGHPSWDGICRHCGEAGQYHRNTDGACPGRYPIGHPMAGQMWRGQWKGANTAFSLAPEQPTDGGV